MCHPNIRENFNNKPTYLYVKTYHKNAFYIKVYPFCIKIISNQSRHVCDMYANYTDWRHIMCYKVLRYVWMHI